jgi:hypothetical protein
VPNSVTAAVAFGLLIVPGFMAVSGFSASRARSSLDRDLYALAQAVVVSLTWLLLVYLFQYPFHIAEHWGVLPIDDEKLAGHRVEIAAAALGLVLAGPFLAGVLFGGFLNAIRHGGGDALDRPEAWEAGWAWARDLARNKAKIRRPPPPLFVTAILKDGRVIKGVSRREVDIAYAPQATRDIFLHQAVEYSREGGDRVRDSKVGAFVSGSEIAAVFYEVEAPEGQVPAA